jgi:hypothetical protein
MKLEVFAAARAVMAIALLPFGAAACSANTSPEAPAGQVEGCGQDSTVSCDQGAGYSCTGNDTPEDTDSSLACSDGVEVDGATLYCCVTFASSTCMPDDTVVGCTGYSYGFSCTGSDTPDQADSTLDCSQPTQANGALLYCCTD